MYLIHLKPQVGSRTLAGQACMSPATWQQAARSTSLFDVFGYIRLFLATVLMLRTPITAAQDQARSEIPLAVLDDAGKAAIRALSRNWLLPA
jgi:hypothetical protein